MRIALDKDSDKARTIGMYLNIFNRDLLLKLYIPGVLTKPDTIQQGEAEGWLRVLNGSKHALKRTCSGFYAQ